MSLEKGKEYGDTGLPGPPHLALIPTVVAGQRRGRDRLASHQLSQLLPTHFDCRYGTFRPAKAIAFPPEQ